MPLKRKTVNVVKDLKKLFCYRFVCNGEKNFTIVRIETIRPLEIGEEVTVSYADDYFDIGECKCHSCNRSSTIEAQQVGLEAQHVGLEAQHVGLEELVQQSTIEHFGLEELVQQPHFQGWSNLVFQG